MPCDLESGLVCPSGSLSWHSALEKGSGADALATFAKIGVRTALNFVFSLLKRAWRKGEDTEMCSEVLQEALALLEPLPPASLFHTQGLSSVWLDAVDKVSHFLTAISSSSRWATHTYTHIHTHTLSHLAPPSPSERALGRASLWVTPCWPSPSSWSWPCSEALCWPC